MTDYVNHALTEFRAAGWIDDKGNYCDDMQRMMCEGILKLLDVFYAEGHSGSTAPYAVSVFEKLAMWKPIAPLTGEDWEWNDTGRDVYQNKRASRVFKDSIDGQAYDIEGKVFWEWCMPYEGREPNEPYKAYYTCRESRVDVTFPYTPTTEYVYRHSDADPKQPLQNETGFL